MGIFWEVAETQLVNSGRIFRIRLPVGDADGDSLGIAKVSAALCAAVLVGGGGRA